MKIVDQIALESKIEVLGTQYKIRVSDDISEFEDCIGWADKTTKEITIFDLDSYDKCNFGDKEKMMRKVLRHEIIHAFMYESGLQESVRWDCEQMVDWIAIQFPKMKETFKKLDILEE